MQNFPMQPFFKKIITNFYITRRKLIYTANRNAHLKRGKKWVTLIQVIQKMKSQVEFWHYLYLTLVYNSIIPSSDLKDSCFSKRKGKQWCLFNGSYTVPKIFWKQHITDLWAAIKFLQNIYSVFGWFWNA